MRPINIITGLRNNFNNQLYRNSFFIAVGKITDVGFGFFFWTVAARLYSVADVGVATALISSLGLIIAFSRFGFDTTVIRFMPSKDKNEVFSTSFWVTSLAAVVISVIYLFILNFISPELLFLRDYAFLFVGFCLVNSITLTTGQGFLALRRADLRLIQNIILGGRILLLFPFVIFGSFGIFASVGFVYIITAIITLIVLHRFISLRFKINRTILQETFQFSLLNYVAGLFQTAPYNILPILILNLTGTEGAAFYYIAFAIGNIVHIIPDAMSSSFFVEVSHGIKIRKAAVRSMIAIYALLIPAVLFLILFGNLLLGLFGVKYLGAFDLLRIISFSALFVPIYNLFIPLQNARLKVWGMFFMTVFRCGLLLGASYIFLVQFGVIGAGYAWLATHFVLMVVIIIFVKWKKWI